jgi:2-polyprenyl-3-methyl-5-hydroxy-6-metoxy-1,4-benzoquinol methylase
MVSAIPTIGHEEIVDGYTQVVDEMYLAEEQSRRELFTWFADAMSGYALKGRRLLEVGANVGLFMHVAGERGWDVRGVEPSKWAVQEGIRRFGVSLKQGTIEELDEPDGSADAVVLLDVLEHLSDPVGALAGLRRIVDDEGILILSTVNLSGVHARVRNGNWPWFIRSHLHYFSPETLHTTLARAGFQMVRWEIVPRAFHLSYIAHRAAGGGNVLGKFVERMARIADPKVPVGWLGDITFVAARPDNR